MGRLWAQGLAAVAIAITAIVVGTKAWAAAQALVALAMDTDPVLLALTAITVGITLLVMHWKDVVKWVKEAWHWLGSHQWTLAILALLGPIGAVVAAVAFLALHWKDVKNAAVAAFNWIKRAANDAWGALKAALSVTVIPVFKALMIAVNAVKDALVWLWNNVLKPVAGFLVGGFTTALKTVQGLFQTILAPITQVWDALKGVFGVLGSIVNWVINAGQKVLGFFSNLASSLGQVSGLAATTPSPAVSSAASGITAGLGLTLPSTTGPHDSGTTPITHPTRQIAHAASGERIPHVTIQIGKHQFATVMREQIIDAMAAGA